jgi:hypothetical protein
MYSNIIDPISNNKYNINTLQAKKILKKYILKAGSSINQQEFPPITDDEDDLVEYEYDQDGNCYVNTLNGTTAIPATECAKLGHPYNKMVKSNKCLVELDEAKLTISHLTNKLDEAKLTISNLTNKLDESNKKFQHSKNNINGYYEILQQLQSKLDSSIGDYERLFFR